MSNNKSKHIFFDDRGKPKKTEEIPLSVKLPENVEYPEHISAVNYFSLQSLEASIEDNLTLKAYFQAIMQNQHLFQGKVALHLTEGINLLYSIFAVRAGCSKVYCVLNGQTQRQLQNIYMMRQIVKENQFQDYIEVLSWKNFNAEVDIIIGEPMGYCLHFDGLLDRIVEARDLHLTKGGLIFPNTLSFKCALLHDQHFYDHKIQYWNNIYGIPMTSMKKWISHEPMIRIVDPTLIVSKVAKIMTLDLQTVSYQEIVKIDKVLELEILGQNQANGIVFWFQTFFTHGNSVKDIKASPWVNSTKFTQTTLYWPTVESYNGGRLRVRIKGQKHPKEGYSVISTEVDDKIYQYSFS